MEASSNNALNKIFARVTLNITTTPTPEKFGIRLSSKGGRFKAYMPPEKISNSIQPYANRVRGDVTFSTYIDDFFQQYGAVTDKTIIEGITTAFAHPEKYSATVVISRGCAAGDFLLVTTRECIDKKEWETIQGRLVRIRDMRSIFISEKGLQLDGGTDIADLDAHINQTCQQYNAREWQQPQPEAAETTKQPEDAPISPTTEKTLLSEAFSQNPAMKNQLYRGKISEKYLKIMKWLDIYMKENNIVLAQNIKDSDKIKEYKQHQLRKALLGKAKRTITLQIEDRMHRCRKIRNKVMHNQINNIEEEHKLFTKHFNELKQWVAKDTVFTAIMQKEERAENPSE